MRRPPSANSSGFKHFQVAPALPQPANSGLLQHLDEWLRGAVQDGQLQRVNIDVDVIHAAGVERREQVLGGGKQHALFHQAGGVADPGDVAPVRFDLKIIQVHAAEDDSRVGRCGHETQMGLHSRMQTNSLGRYRPFNRGLVGHVKAKS